MTRSAASPHHQGHPPTRPAAARQTPWAIRPCPAARQHHETAKPDECIPRALFVRGMSCQSMTRVTREQGEPEIRDRRRRRAVPFAREPEQQHGREDRQHHALPPQHPAPSTAAARRQRLRGRRVADGWRAEPTRRGTTTSPTAPGPTPRTPTSSTSPPCPDPCRASSATSGFGAVAVRNIADTTRSPDRASSVGTRRSASRRARLRSERPRDVQRDGKRMPPARAVLDGVIGDITRSARTME